MNLIVDIVGIVCASIFSALALYGAIRKDLATAVTTASVAHESATRAHTRIDSLMEHKK